MSVEEYIEKCPEERQDAMNELRDMLLRAFPYLEETTKYKMPTYSLGGQYLFSFASQKKYMAFYVCHYDLLLHFPKIIAKYDCGKSCIRFRKCDASVITDLKVISNYVYKNFKAT